MAEKEYLKVMSAWTESDAQELSNCDEKELEDRFYRNLEFGTGGLRGIIAAGTNRMNIYTVAKASAGLAAYLNAHYPSPSCAIAYDSRINSELFARTAASVLAGAGVAVHIYKELMPTPMLSYAVRYLKCSAGIVITASHNPARYNGYKVYDADGCQITLEAADKITSHIERQPLRFDIADDFPLHLGVGRIRYISDEVIQSYLNTVKEQGFGMRDVPLRVVYSPLNGAGNKSVRETLSRYPNIELIIVKQQEEPDGTFPTCPYPNPETPQAMELTRTILSETGADLGFATDPDCDRIGVIVGDTIISGNELGVLLFDYICKRRIEDGHMPDSPVAVTTIVSTDMAGRIAEKYGVELRRVLTGFKFIGEQIGLLEGVGESGRFIFGFEESCGYLSGGYVRDKDAVSASLLVCEMAAYYKARGLTLSDALLGLYKEHGYFQSSLLSFTFEGADGMDRMNALLDSLRHDTAEHFGGMTISSVTDYSSDQTGLPKSNVISCTLSNGARIVVRPSGTEPKLKMYLEASGHDRQSVRRLLDNLSEVCRTSVPQ